MAKSIYGFSDWDKAFLSQEEMDEITGLRQKADAGEISWSDANKGAESIRARYGYSGGGDGSEWIQKPQKIDAAYDGSRAQEAIGAQERKLDGMTYEKFTEGSEYAALLDKYTKAGSRAMEDTVGTVAGRTGGMASSYAQTAGQQAFNQYMEGLDDAGKELYRQEYEKEKQRLQDMRTQEQQDYSRFLDTVALAKDERQYQQDVGQQILDNQRYEKQQAVAAEDRLYERERDAKADGDAQKADARDRVAAYLSQNGSLDGLDASILQSSGYTEAELAAMVKAAQEQNAAAAALQEQEIWKEDYDRALDAATKTGDYSAMAAFGWTEDMMAGGKADWDYDHRSTAKGSGGGGKPKFTWAQVKEELENGNTSKAILDAYEYYMGEPYEDETPTVDESNLQTQEAKNLWDRYKSGELTVSEVNEKIRENRRLIKEDKQLLYALMGVGLEG